MARAHDSDNGIGPCLHNIFEKYKSGTAIVVDWLLKNGSPKSNPKSQTHTDRLPVRKLLDLAHAAAEKKAASSKRCLLDLQECSILQARVDQLLQEATMHFGADRSIHLSPQTFQRNFGSSLRRVIPRDACCNLVEEEVKLTCHQGWTCDQHQPLRDAQ